MTIDEYKNAVIELFKSGNATPEQWGEMANAVLNASEGDEKTMFMTDKYILDQECPECLEFVGQQELDTFGGVCENCNEQKL